MSTRFAIVWTVACAACNHAPSDPVPTPDGANGATSLEAALDAEGFMTQAGAFSFFDTSDCCSLPSCFGNNPTSPYASFLLPPAPGQTAQNPGADADGMSSSWRLAQDEALVWLGTTPPRAKYFGFTPYVYDRQHGSTRELLFASTGDTLNQMTASVAGGSPWDTTLAVIFTANRTTATKVRAALVAAGTPDAAINVIAIPAATTHLGIDDAADTVDLLFRVALFDDPAAGDAWRAASHGQVFRATPAQAIASDPYDLEPLRATGTGVSEASLAASVDKLRLAIINAAPSLTATDMPITIKTPFQNDQYGTYCLANDVNCFGDNRDTLYPSSSPFFLPAAAGNFVMVYGVNHAAAGKALYSNVAVYDYERAMGVASIEDGTFAGSAQRFLPGDPNAAKLYAWKIARNCAGDPYCSAIPAACPGVALDKPALVAFRAYVEPATRTRPDPAELVIDRALRFRPN